MRGVIVTRIGFTEIVLDLDDEEFISTSMWLRPRDGPCGQYLLYDMGNLKIVFHDSQPVPCHLMLRQRDLCEEESEQFRTQAA